MSVQKRSAALYAVVSLVALAAPLGAMAQPPRLLAPATASGEPYSFADLVERVSPAVVSVFVEREVERQEIPSALQQFFQFRFGQPGQPDPRNPRGEDDFDGGEDTVEAQGSGFFIDALGHIVTNNHVIDGATKIEVRLSDGSTKTAKLIGADPLTDLAVLKVEPAKGQTYVQFAEETNLRVGDWVVAVGNPFGLGGTVTSGIVSAIGGESREGQFLDFIQIDAPINRGNSGGPTFDVKGRVVGVNTAIYSPSGGSVGIGFAIPAKAAKETVAQLISKGSVTRGWLGVSLQDVTPELASALGRKGAQGALIREILPGTPAANAGLQGGDLILDVNGRAVKNSSELSRAVAALPPRSVAKVRVLRDRAERVVNVTLGVRDEKAQVASNDPSGPPGAAQGSVASDIGLRMQDLTPALRQQLRLPQNLAGVAVTGVKSGSAAAAAGLETGVVLLEIDSKPATNAATAKRLFDEAKRAGKDAVLVRFQAGDVKAFGAVRLGKE
jgi:serine protease Do